MTAPDYADAIIGWRAWHVVETPEGLRLHAVARDVIWEPGDAYHATCLRTRRWLERFRPRPPHSAPAFDCTCGVWAVPTPQRALVALDVYGRRWKPLHRVIGTVALWGEVVEHDGGWRAERAYPQRILVPSRRLHGAPVDDVTAIADALAVYGVPVTLVDGGSRSQLRRELATAPG